MEYKNLREKTIFDFCDDPQILDLIAIVSKEEYLDHIKSNPVYNGFGLLDLAEMTGNKELEMATRREYSKEFDEFYNE